MKASLCKLSSSTIARVCDYHAKLFLIAISCTLKSLLRPHVLNTPDKSPGDRLTEICSKITDIGRDCPGTGWFVLDHSSFRLRMGSLRLRERRATPLGTAGTGSAVWDRLFYHEPGDVLLLFQTLTR